MPAKSKSAAKRRPAPLAAKPAAAPAKVVKIGKRLESVAREIKDADDFVEHVAGLAKRFRREHALRIGDAQTELRQSLRTFHKHASALAEWLEQANNGKATAIERKAFDAFGTKLYGSPVLARPPSAQALDWLTRASEAADATAIEMKQGGADDALRIAAEGLRATFEHHKLKLAAGTDKKPGDAVRLLCAIAREAGETIEPATAKAALKDTHRPAAAA
ncbi:hypothetical protein [Steroidobacter agaridevorans]|uniref:hypothetical protein n=1 Tax=Steroidobacter agaridevorans TaxID=2695856 RepID=UPI001326330C|nr:hypothetical protein [Steroidobacter agaridevorans]GFE85411.1 hypothetical protein GCM10011488_03650 [Steroidobacter agaridevorans]